MTTENQLVTVTGASGFIALHCIQQLLQAGYRVRGTLRSLSKEAEVRAALKLDDEANARLSFVAANLMEDTGWREAMSGADYVLHVASPFPPAPPKNPDDLIKPAREGTIRVLSAARDAGVKRVVVTSSTAAIFPGNELAEGQAFTEEMWSDLSKDIGAYERSKTLAERAAWEFMENSLNGSNMQLATVNPSLVLGPGMGDAANTSNEALAKLLRREVPGVPRLQVPTVDVRDVASGHLRAMTTPDAAGKRFILSAADTWFTDFATVLKQGGYRVPTWVLPDWLVRVVGLFDGSVRLVAPNLGKHMRNSNERARSILGWIPRSIEETILDTAADITARSH